MDDIDSFDLKKLTDHYPVGADMTLQVLKGHLIFEEILRDLLDSSLPFPDALKGERDASLTCHQVICLVNALAPLRVRHRTWLWIAAKQLNNLRNDLAHKLGASGIDEKINSFVKTVRLSDQDVSNYFDQHSSPEGEFTMCISTLCGLFSRMKQHVQDGPEVGA